MKKESYRPMDKFRLCGLTTGVKVNQGFKSYCMKKRTFFIKFFIKPFNNLKELLSHSLQISYSMQTAGFLYSETFN